MQEEIKCPQCGGNKFSDRGNNTYKCMYCGSTFSTKKLEEVKPHETTKQANPSSNVTVNVNDNNKNTLADAKALFERLWKAYPNKKGKGQVSDAQKKRLLAIGEDRLVKAIDRYSLELQKDADWRKAQYGSTFFNSGYVDYLDENYVPGKATEHKGKSNAFSNINHRQYDYDELEKQVLNSQPGGG